MMNQRQWSRFFISDLLTLLIMEFKASGYGLLHMAHILHVGFNPIS